MKLFFIVLTLYSFYVSIVNSRKTGGGYKEAITSCNEYIDSMIEEVLRENEDYFDPHPINESLITFRKKVVFIDFKGEAKLTQGFISGLKNMHRVSSCSLSFEQGRLKLSVKLEVDQMLFNFTGSLKAININNVISVKGDTSTVFLSTSISLDADGKDSILENLNTDYLSNISMTVEGTRFLGWMEEPMKTSIAQFFKALTEKLVEVEIKKLLDEKMMEKPFSLEKFDIDISDINDIKTTTVKEDLVGEMVYTKEDSNSYIDSVLENRFLLEAEYSKIDPYLLPDDRIDHPYVSKEKENYMDLKNGFLEDLTNIKRIQDCSQPVLRASNITFTCFLGFQKLKFLYSVEAHNGDVISVFEIVTLVDATRLGIKITSMIKDNVPSLVDLTINNLGKLTVKVAHTIADAPVLEAESAFHKVNIVKHFSESLRKVILGKLKEVLGYSIYKTPIHFVE